MALSPSNEEKQSKIIHMDMDCFYAAIEIRDNPSLADKPVAVGGSPERRGVICTCNYIARQYGIHSAMASALAYRHCNDLIVLPVNMPKYRQVAKKIHNIFGEFTDLIEPLGLDEAYLDVTNSSQCNNSATLIAKAIRNRIWESENLIASAGVAPNKFLAKIASGWKKPNGLFVICPNQIETFIQTLPVDNLYGVGKVTAKKLHNLNLKTCSDLQKLSLSELASQFGKLGQTLYEQCRGIDCRQVEPNRIRKSLSVEQTFPQDINNIDTCLHIINELYSKLMLRVQEAESRYPIKNQYIKLKFSNFKLTTSETISTEINLELFRELFREAYEREKKSIRLLGLGIHFNPEKQSESYLQESLF